MDYLLLKFHIAIIIIIFIHFFNYYCYQQFYVLLPFLNYLFIFSKKTIIIIIIALFQPIFNLPSRYYY